MNPNNHQQLSAVVKLLRAVVLLLAILFTGTLVVYFGHGTKKQNPTPDISKNSENVLQTASFWQAPDVNAISDRTEKEQVAYGKELVAHTAKYLGPKGSIAQITNGMNCQNCHLDAGTKVFGNNYAMVASTYPKFRARSGTEEDIYKRINDCMERSLNGKPLDTQSKEMQALKAYINFIGSNVKKEEKVLGAGFKELAFLDRAASPQKGKLIYESKCASCHQTNGEGLLNAEGNEYGFPPLWGKHSYNDKAGLYRITFFAKYVKYNMPLGASHEQPQLTDEEAWDVAAFVNTMPRPTKSTPKDWPDISKKPIDHPFGPYNDGFTEEQHKLGPFKPIKDKRDEK